MVFKFFSPPKDSPDIIDPPQEVVDEGLDFWRTLHLIGKSFQKRLPFKVVQDAAAKLWTSYGLTHTILGDNNTFLFRFSSSSQAQKVLSLGPWSIAGKPFSLLRWTNQIQSQPSTIACIPTWIKFFNIPLNYWTTNGLSYIASSVGEPLYADQATEDRTKLKFARLCVNVDFQKPLRNVVQLKMEGNLVNIKVEYQWIPKFCSKCHQLSHTVNSCPLNIIQPPPLQINKPSSQQNNTPMIDHRPAIQPTTEWVTIRRKKSKPPVNTAQTSKQPSSSSTPAHNTNHFQPLTNPQLIHCTPPSTNNIIVHRPL
ncbi:uncharacterized protein LOC132314132 [Cornus florida]|uniref:uncharacterized protein LOC132314132 n=1 Tax=Cornus florida TaxID=4283 RepID=UPI00289D40A1|nr:uncharacterized protein LOC132314132 [Cornus florida]